MLLLLLLLLLLLGGEFGAGVPAAGAVVDERPDDSVVCLGADDVDDGFAAGEEERPVREAGLADEEGAVGVGAAWGGQGCANLGFS